jgi:uncharacterized membrane protein
MSISTEQRVAVAVVWQKKAKSERKINAIRNREKQSKTSIMAWHLISALFRIVCAIFVEMEIFFFAAAAAG